MASEKLYIVALCAGHSARADQHRFGVLTCWSHIMLYSRGEALKKARMFGGEILPVAMPFKKVKSKQKRRK